MLQTLPILSYIALKYGWVSSAYCVLIKVWHCMPIVHPVFVYCSNLRMYCQTTCSKYLALNTKHFASTCTYLMIKQKATSLKQKDTPKLELTFLEGLMSPWLLKTLLNEIGYQFCYDFLAQSGPCIEVAINCKLQYWMIYYILNYMSTAEHTPAVQQDKLP